MDRGVLMCERAISMSNNNSDTAPTAMLTQRRSARTGNTIAGRVGQARKERVDLSDVGWGRNKVVGIDKVLHVRAVRGCKDGCGFYCWGPGIITSSPGEEERRESARKSTTARRRHK